MNEITKGSKWEATYAYEGEDVKKLMEEGWEPYGVRKGDFVISGMSLGWLLGHTIFYFKRPVQETKGE